MVCTITGTGLKDPDTAIAGLPEPAIVAADAGGGCCRARTGVSAP